MKREERLHRLFGGIEDELIEDAAQPTALLYVWLPRLAAVAAAVVLTVGIALGPWWEQSPLPITPPTSDDSSQEDTTTSTTTNLTATQAEDSSATEDSTTTDSQTTVSSSVITSHTTQYTSKSYTSGGKTTKHTDKSTTDKTYIIPTATHNAGTVTKSTLKTTAKGSMKTNAKTTAKTTTQTNAKTTSKCTITTWTTQTATTTTLPWSGTSIIDVFPTFRWNTPTSLYQVKKVPVNRSDLSSPITDITVSGHDDNTDHTITAHLAYVNGIHMSAAVAIRYGSDSTYYPATNKGYWPTTLGKLVNDLWLAKYLEVGTIHYAYADEENNVHEAEYTGLTTETLCELLLSNASLPNIYEESMTFSDTINVSISLPVLDEYGILTVSKDGYLYTDLLSSGKAFYIGEETASAFWDYVQNHCTQTSVE